MELDNGFDIPDSRKDLTNKNNIRWLLRNIQIRNGNHPKLKETIQALKLFIRKD